MATSSWYRVAAGFQLIAQAVVDQTAKEVGTAASRAARHGTDLVSTVVVSTSSRLSSTDLSSKHTSESFMNHAPAPNFHIKKRTSEWPKETSSARQDAPIEPPSSLFHSPLETEQFSPPSAANASADSIVDEIRQNKDGNASAKSSFDMRTSPLPLSFSEKLSQEEINRSVEPKSAADANVTNTVDMNDPVYKSHLSKADTMSTEQSKDTSSDSLAAASTNIRTTTSSEKEDEYLNNNNVLEYAESNNRRLEEGSAVPSTRFGRAVGFASLGLGLAVGSAAESVSRLFRGPSENDANRSLLATASNSDRLAASLCRMRGAALKMGQMLSIQDESLMPPELMRALNKVRQGADAMPRRQLLQQLVSQLGADWRDRFVDFNETPFAAASIGQVHRGSILRNGEAIPVVIKVQYPGVGNSIASDLRNLSMLVSWTGLAPKGLFLDNVIRVGEAELQAECDYVRELDNQHSMKKLVESDPILRENKFTVPEAYSEWSTEQVLTSDFCPGGTIDKVLHLDQEERNRIGHAIMYLTIQELFVWRTMQTDPQWANYLYDVGSGTTSLIDFGALRDYSKEFVDGYLRIVWASANRDEETLMAQSHRMKFLTGEENEIMRRAHKLSGYTVGEPFFSKEAFDFCGSNISTRMGEHTSVFLKHRLTPPPEEVYTLHRKLAGAYMLCIKLGAKVQCRELLENVVANHEFNDNLGPIVI